MAFMEQYLANAFDPNIRLMTKLIDSEAETKKKQYLLDSSERIVKLSERIGELEKQTQSASTRQQIAVLLKLVEALMT